MKKVSVIICVLIPLYSALGEVFGPKEIVNLAVSNNNCHVKSDYAEIKTSNKPAILKCPEIKIPQCWDYNGASTITVSLKAGKLNGVFKMDMNSELSGHNFMLASDGHGKTLILDGIMVANFKNLVMLPELTANDWIDLVIELYNDSGNLTLKITSCCKTKKNVVYQRSLRDYDWPTSVFPKLTIPANSNVQIKSIEISSIGLSKFPSSALNVPQWKNIVNSSEMNSNNSVWPKTMALNWDYNCLYLNGEEMREFLIAVKEAGFNQVNFRVSMNGLYFDKINNGTFLPQLLDAFGKNNAPVDAFIRLCKELGLKSCIYFDLFEGGWDKVLLDNPGLCAQGKPGKAICSGFPCYAEPTVQRYMLGRVQELAEKQPDMFFFCTKSFHITSKAAPRNFDSGYNGPIRKEYIRRYGTDPVNGKIDYNAFQKLRGEYVIDFLVKAKEILNAKNIKSIVGTTVSGNVMSSRMIIPWEDIVKRKAADIICLSVSRWEEAWRFYQDDGLDVLKGINKKCEENGLEFWAYVLTDSGPNLVVDRAFGPSGEALYLQAQSRWLAGSGVTGLLYHDLELIYRQSPSLMQAAASHDMGLAVKTTPARPDTVILRYAGQVPDGDFESNNPGQWFVREIWQDETTVSGNSDFGAGPGSNGCKSEPTGWKLTSHRQISNKSALYRVGRAPNLEKMGPVYKGFYAPFIDVATLGKTEVASWNALQTLPQTVATLPINCSVFVAGQNVENVKTAGLKILFYDAASHMIDAKTVLCDLSQIKEWQKITINAVIPQNAYKYEISLFVETGANSKSAGLVFFDNFKIGTCFKTANNQIPKMEYRKSDSAVSGTQVGRFVARRGYDWCTLPFRLDTSKESYFTINLRSHDSVKTEIIFIVGDKRLSIGKLLTGNWQNLKISLPANIKNGRGQLIIRSAADGIIEVDDAKIIGDK